MPMRPTKRKRTGKELVFRTISVTIPATIDMPVRINQIMRRLRHIDNFFTLQLNLPDFSCAVLVNKNYKPTKIGFKDMELGRGNQCTII
jgi:hypothetical protein